MKFVHLQILTVALTVTTLLGCGGASGPAVPAGPKASVKGKVTHDGKPVTKGTLTLDSGKGYIASANLAADGTFELQGANGKEFPAGTYKVGVTPPANPPPPPGSATMPPPPTIEGLPEKFYSPANSGVTVEVKEGKQELSIDLK